MGLVEITVASLKEAAAKLPEATKDKPRSAVDQGIAVSAANNEGGKVVVPDTTAARVNELLGIKPEAASVSAETQTESDLSDTTNPTDRTDLTGASAAETETEEEDTNAAA